MAIDKVQWAITDIKGNDVPGDVWLVDPTNQLKAKFYPKDPGYYKTALKVTVDGQDIDASVECVYLGVPLSLNIVAATQSDLDTALATIDTPHKHLNLYLSGTVELDFAKLAKSNAQWLGNTVNVFAMSKTALLKLKGIAIQNWFEASAFAPKAGASYRFTSLAQSSTDYVFERLNTTNDDIVSIGEVTAEEVDDSTS